MMSHSKSKPFTEKICRLTKPLTAKLYQLIIIAFRNIENVERFGLELDTFELAGIEYSLLTVRTGHWSYSIDIRRARTTGQIKIMRPDYRSIRHALAYIGLILNLNELL